MLTFDQLTLKQATIEIRYDNAYLLWDRSGLVWSEITKERPSAKMVKAEPMVSAFTLDDRFELTVTLDKAHLVDHTANSSLKEFTELAGTFIDIVTKSLEINKFTRIGFRVIYNKYFENKFAAADALMSTKLLSGPEGKHFNIQGKISMPTYSLVWEGESTALRAVLTARNKKIDFDVTPGLEELSSVHIEKPEVVYDVDYYTLSHILKGQFNTRDWITQAYHLIKRDSKVFMARN